MILLRNSRSRGTYIHGGKKVIHSEILGKLFHWKELEHWLDFTALCVNLTSICNRTIALLNCVCVHTNGHLYLWQSMFLITQLVDGGEN